jgi:hypothetical protein
MRRWILVRAREDLTRVRRPNGRGFVGHSPTWIDTHEGMDFYAKLVRQGLLDVLTEADERPSPVHPSQTLELVETEDEDIAPATGRRTRR